MPKIWQKFLTVLSKIAALQQQLLAARLQLKSACSGGLEKCPDRPG